MLGFYPISTLPISTLQTTATVGVSRTTAGGAGDGARQLTAHERRRRKRHLQQIAAYREQFEALLADAPDVPAVRAVANTVIARLPVADDVGAEARRAFVQFFAPDPALGRAIVLPTDRGDIRREEQQKRQIADVAVRLRAAIANARVVREFEDDEEDVVAMLLLL